MLAQLTQANIEQQQRDVARDAAVAAGVAAHTREDNIRASIGKVDKCSGDDKPKLRRWLKYLTTLHATQAGIVVAVAERTSRDNLADTVETFLADPANAPNANVGWPALRTALENALLGEAYYEVLRAEHRVIVQKAHE